MTAHQAARERIRQEVAATRERNHRITHDLTTESLLNDLGPALWLSFNAGYKHPGATPGTRTGVSTIQKTHIYDPKADGAAKRTTAVGGKVCERCKGVGLPRPTCPDIPARVAGYTAPAGATWKLSGGTA